MKENGTAKIQFYISAQCVCVCVCVCESLDEGRTILTISLKADLERRRDKNEYEDLYNILLYAYTCVHNCSWIKGYF